MRKLIMLLAVMFAAAIPSLAQDYPTTEIFGGYSFLSAKPFGERESLHGWGFSFAGNFGPRWGGVAEFSGHYGSTVITVPVIGPVEEDINIYTFLFGPRVSARGDSATAFGHVLLGGARLSLAGLSSTDFAMAIGGGVDVNAGKNFAIRVVQADYVPNRIGGSWNSDFRVQAGVVIKLGGD
jgi:hypothetical protein